jgi:hypothetical protein
MKALFLTVCMAIALSGCAGYVQHPGSVNMVESKIYDVVSDAKSVIDYSRPQLASGVLPAKLKPAFTALVDAYNVAAPALKAYDAAVRAGQPADTKLIQLNAAMAALTQSLTAFKGAK